MRETLSGSDRLIVPEGRDTLRDAVPSAVSDRVTTELGVMVGTWVIVGGMDVDADKEYVCVYVDV